MGKCKLKIDCSQLTPAAIDKLMGSLSMFVNPVFVGGDTIYVDDKVHADIYTSIWKILDSFNVKVE